MAVNVAVDDNLFVLYFRDLMHQGLCEINFRVELPAWDDPLPIQVDTGNWTAVVATHYSIWVHAWDHPNYEVGEHSCTFSVFDQWIQKSFKYRACICLARMHPRCHKYGFSPRGLNKASLLATATCCDVYFGNRKTTYCLAKQLSVVDQTSIRYPFRKETCAFVPTGIGSIFASILFRASQLANSVLEVKQVSHDLGVWVWLGIGEIHSVVWIGELEFKIHLVEVALSHTACWTHLMIISISALSVHIEIILVHASILFIVQVKRTGCVPATALKPWLEVFYIGAYPLPLLLNYASLLQQDGALRQRLSLRIIFIVVGNLSFKLLYILLLGPLAEHMHLHTLLEERERLREVADAKMVLGLLSGARVRHLEEEPLLVAFGVRVYFAEQIVSLQDWLSCLATLLYVVCADVLGLSSVKITRLEHRVEYKLLTSQTLPFSEHANIVS